MPTTAHTSPFVDCPEKFLSMGQRVRAKIRVWDGGPDAGDFLHAEPGDEGVVVHVQKGCWPTVTFDRTGTSTCVFDAEVEPIPVDNSSTNL